MKKVQNGTGTLADLAAPEIQAKVARPLISVKEIKEVAETASQEEINKAVVEARRYIAEIPGFMSRSVARIRAIQVASVEERLFRSSELETLISSVLSHLEINGSATPEEKLLNEAARQAYAKALVSTLPVADHQSLADVVKGGASRLPGLIRVGILEPLGDGKSKVSVKVGGNIYKVNGGHTFAMEIADALSRNSAEAAKVARENFRSFREMAEELKTQATISVPEMLVRKSGKFFISVPDDKNGDRFLPGGVLLGESDGRAIKVFKAIGHFQRIMGEIAETGTFVPVESLGQERLNLAKRLSDEKFKLARILHAVLRRGLAADLAARQKLAAIPKSDSVLGTSGEIIQTAPVPATIQ